MRVLFLHQNFPGQFLHVASALRRQAGHELLAVVPEGHDRPPLIPLRAYRFDTPTTSPALGLAGPFAQSAARGEAVARTLRALRQKGFRPDLIIGHPGWGETLFVRDVWPDCRIVLHAEFFYSAEASEAGFDPEFAGTRPDDFAVRIRARNVPMTMAMLDADVAVAPTAWQASRFPSHAREKIEVIHEGIDTSRIQPSADGIAGLDHAGLTFRAGDEVVTFVNRNLEPHRGFHVFMRALPEILARRTRAHAVIVGGEGTSYGPPAASGKSWKDVMLAEVAGRLDLARVHFVGWVPHATLVRLFQVSAAHVYLTYPFVLSWSMLEAMSAGTLVIGSRTPPVEEIIEHGKNGILRDFFDVAGFADAVVDALANPTRYNTQRMEARRTIEQRFDLRRVCLPRWLTLLGELCRG
jgi:glycosyltransferase involved in cell wall biosynthesis